MFIEINFYQNYYIELIVFIDEKIEKMKTYLAFQRGLFVLFMITTCGLLNNCSNDDFIVDQNDQNNAQIMTRKESWHWRCPHGFGFLLWLFKSWVEK